jgi:serine protease AprX
MMTLVRRTFLRSLATVAIALLVVTAAQAGPRRARLSKDLVDRLAAGDQSSTRVIVSGSREQIDTLATRYGVRVHKTLRNGAVLEVSGGQLDALTQDPEVESVSSDAPVRRMMAVTTSAIGADQVWSGALQGISAYSGRGIGVAIIDSGVGNHRDLAGRVVASVDFTDSSSGEPDGYGHGTHVAGIIAGWRRARTSSAFARSATTGRARPAP